MRNLKHILVVFVITAFFSSCANSNTKTNAAEKKAETSLELADDQNTPPQAHTPAAPPAEIKVGDNILETLKTITVRDLGNKELAMTDIMADKSIIMLAKPGCIFCESFLAVANSTKLKTKVKLISVLDKAHADFKTFKEKSAKYSNLKASWVYDEGNAMHDKLGMTSFPRFLVVDKKGNVLHNQVGLVMPENKEELGTKQFPEVLQALSIETSRWLTSLK